MYVDICMYMYKSIYMYIYIQSPLSNTHTHLSNSRSGICSIHLSLLFSLCQLFPPLPSPFHSSLLACFPVAALVCVFLLCATISFTPYISE